MLNIFNDSSRQRQMGIGLIELMIAMTLSLLIGAAVIQVFLGQRQTFRTQDDMARIQENARFALEQIARDVRFVGFWGCSRRAPITNATGNSLNDALADTAVTGTANSLNLVFVTPSPTVEVSAGAANQDAFTSASTRLIADCTNATVFTGSANTFPAGFGNGAQIFQLSRVTYSLSGAQLMRGTDSIIDSGVQGFAVDYGFDSTGDDVIDSYRTANDVGTNWGSVRSIRVVLTLRGEVVGDQVFKSVIAIRNRLP